MRRVFGYSKFARYLLALGLGLPLLAPTAGWAQVLNLPGLITGTPVQQTSSDEVALAGKGFTPEVESGSGASTRRWISPRWTKLRALRWTPPPCRPLSRKET